MARDMLPDDPQAVAFVNEHVRFVADALAQADFACARLLNVYQSKVDESGMTIQQRLEAAAPSLVMPDGGDTDGRGAVSVADVLGVISLCQSIQAFMNAERRALLRRVAVNPML